MSEKQRKPYAGTSGSLFEAHESSGAETSQPRTLVAHIDGGARGNPGPAGYGVHLKDTEANVVAEISRYLGHRTNNFAEYSALLAALEYSLAHDWLALRVISDSELLVKQINGEYKVRNPDLKELYDRAKSLARKLKSFSIRHVLRSQNKDADRLANWAMDNPAISASGYMHPLTLNRARGKR
jgi:ribonuclease HI